jgi:WD40 repeat protein
VKAKWRKKAANNTPLALPLIVYDAKRFLLSHSSIIEEAPLQVYCSALVFSPEKSITRAHYCDQVPKWILHRPSISENWDPYLQILSHSNAVTAVAFSPDGKLVASGSDDRTVRLWDATTGTERRVLKGHSDSVTAVTFPLDGKTAVAFSPDGKLVASGSDDGTVRLWDATTGTERRVLKGHSNGARAVAFSPDGKLVAFGSFDCTVRLWDATGTERRVLKGHSHWVTAVAFSPDGKLVASGSDDRTVRLWDASTGTESHVFTLDVPLLYLCFSPCGRYLVTNRGILRPLLVAPQPLPQISASKTWIMEDGEDLLFLHPDYRDSLLFIAENVVVAMDSSGRGSALRLSSSVKSMVGHI